MVTRTIHDVLTNVQTTGGESIFLDANGDPSPAPNTDYEPVYNVKKLDGTDVLGTTYLKALDRITFYPPENGVTIVYDISVDEAGVTPAPVSAGESAYGKSTYDQIIDAVLSDIPKAELQRLPPQAFMDWILRAEERICRLTTVRDEFVLHYTSGVADYALRNRPPITLASVGPPIQVTATAHGILDNTRVHIFGGQGNTAVNGTWFVSNRAANTFVINPGIYIKDVKIVTPVAIGVSGTFRIWTDGPHGWTTGQTVTIGGINTVITDYAYVITVIDTTSFTITRNNLGVDYTSGGVAYLTSASTGNGVYTGGARVWVDTELPTYFGKVLGASFYYGSWPYNARAYPIDSLNRERTMYRSQYPYRLAIYTKGGLKYLRLETVPSMNGDLTVYGEVQITPRDHYQDDPALTVQLSSEYDPAIIDFVKARAWERLGDRNAMKDSDNDFDRRIKEINMNDTPSLIDIVYK